VDPLGQFGGCYLLIFGQLAVGGIAGLAVPPFAVIERGFYKSSAGIFLGAALVYLAGRIELALRAGALPPHALAELVLWAVFAAATARYLAALWDEASAARMRRYPWALFSGLAALVLTADGYRLGGAVGSGMLLYPFAFLTGAASLGAVATGMLLGHWYLIDLGLSIAPLRRLLRYFVAVTGLHTAVIVGTLAAFAVLPGPTAAAAATLWRDQLPLFATRLVLGPVAALAIAYLIHRTLAIPQTMAATGLFYIAILFVLVGEMLGRLVLFRTSLPL
jgi:hypothetical protein